MIAETPRRPVFSANNLSTVGANITIPSSNGTSILSNTPVRLRLCSDLLSVTGPCHAPDYGQVEDYLLIINQQIKKAINKTWDEMTSVAASHFK